MTKNNDISLESNETLSTQIYDYLKNAIISNQIKSKEIINKKKIAAQFDASMTPIREALLKLIGEGFIEVDEFRNAVVKETSHEEFQEMSETLSLLDSYACNQAIEELTDTDLQTLTDMTNKMESLCSVETLKEYLEANFQIHTYIWDSMKNRFMRKLIGYAFDHYVLSYRQIFISQWALHSTLLKQSLKFHKALLEILISRDKSKLSRVVKNHWPLLPLKPM